MWRINCNAAPEHASLICAISLSRRANDNLISISRLLGESQLTHQEPMALPFRSYIQLWSWLLRSLMDIIVFNYFIIRLRFLSVVVVFVKDGRKIDNNDKAEER